MTDLQKEIDIDQLKASSRILHLVHHRNKNQHRQGKWWKWLSILKRCTAKLAGELGSRDDGRSQARIVYMDDFLLPKCYLAFTQVIKDNQFAALGLVLVAEVSRTQRVLGLTDWQLDSSSPMVGIAATSGMDASAWMSSEDTGEAVERSMESTPGRPSHALPIPPGFEPSSTVDAVEEPLSSSATHTSNLATEKGVKIKKRKKSGNLIDDLFQGL